MESHRGRSAAAERDRRTPGHCYRRISPLLAASAVLLALVIAPSVAVAEEAISPLYWSGGFSADPGGDLAGVSCVSGSLCVAVDRLGKVLWSTNPSGEPAVWSVASVAGSAGAVAGGISCVSGPLCVAVGEGQVLTSSDPAGGGGAWKVEPIDEGRSVSGIACVSTSLCLALGGNGLLLTTSEPAAGAASWKAADIDSEGVLTSVSCASVSLCVAFDADGNVLSSSEPTGGASAWSSAHVAPRSADVSCLPGPLCIATSGGEIVSSSDPAGGASAWTASRGPEANSITCASASLCVAWESATNSGLSDSAEPAGGEDAWASGHVGAWKVWGVSCPSTSFCVANIGGQMAVSMPAHVLAVSLLGSGKVTSTPIACPWATCGQAPRGIIEPTPWTSISCQDVSFSGPCALAFPESDDATLTATAGAGFSFYGWSGACTGSGTCTLSMASSQSVGAEFGASAPCACGPGFEEQPSPLPPSLTSLGESYATFAVGEASTPLTGSTARRVHSGTTFSFELNRDATVKLLIRRLSRGRSVHGKCHPEGRRLLNKPRCSRTVAIAMLTRHSQAGANEIVFSGRIGRKALPPGHYRAVFTASDSSGASSPGTLAFTIVRR